MHGHVVGVGFDNVDDDPPTPGEPGFHAAKPVASVVATTMRRRLSKVDQERKLKLLALATAIRGAVERDNRAAAGAKLCEAKALLEHGQFVAWVERECGLNLNGRPDDTKSDFENGQHLSIKHFILYSHRFQYVSC